MIADDDLSKHIDMVALNELKDVMEEEFPILLETFIEDSQLRLEDMRKAVENAESDDLLRSAHSFKGSCGNIGAFHLSELCKQAEDMGRSAKLDQAKDLMLGIETEYACIREILENELRAAH